MNLQERPNRKKEKPPRNAKGLCKWLARLASSSWSGVEKEGRRRLGSLVVIATMTMELRDWAATSLLCDESVVGDDDHRHDRDAEFGEEVSLAEPDGIAGAESGAGARLELWESMLLLLGQEKLTRLLPCRGYVRSMSGMGSQFRRAWVHWIFKLQRLLGLGVSTAGRAVSMLDRFLSTEDFQPSDMKLVAIACTRIAAKYDDGNTLVPQLLFSLKEVLQVEYQAAQVLEMEVRVLQALGWSAVTVTPCDFIDNIIQHLASDMPLLVVRSLESRAEELVGGILPEAAFLVYQPSVVGLCVVQCLLDEYFPLQAATFLDLLRATLSVDMVAAWECYQVMMDLVVDPNPVQDLPSPDHVADLYRRPEFRSSPK